MADVFISYAREDRPQADALARSLQSMGFDVFWDNEIPPGRTWADFIEAKLKACKVMLVLWSSASVGSQWVREEARIGRDSGKLIPVVMDGSQPPFGFGELQTANLSDWRGDANHAGFLKLADAIRSFADQPGSAPRRPQQQPSPPHQGSSFQQPPKFETRTGPGGVERLSPMGYIQKCLRLYATGAGRANRPEFWWFFLFSLIAYVVGYFIDIEMFGVDYYGAPILPAISTVVALALVAPFIAVTSRRLHDIGLTGWIAIASIIPIVAIVIGLIPSSREANQYGPATSAA